MYITPELVNSDVIENVFNQQRSTYHEANSNPSALKCQQVMRPKHSLKKSNAATNARIKYEQCHLYLNPT
jgi:hypothetical protein